MSREYKICRGCGQPTLIHVDDEGGIGGARWDMYACSICLTTVSVLYNQETWEFRNLFIERDEETLRKEYRKLFKGN